MKSWTIRVGRQHFYTITVRAGSFDEACLIHSRQSGRKIRDMYLVKVEVGRDELLADV